VGSEAVSRLIKESTVTSAVKLGNDFEYLG